MPIIRVFRRVVQIAAFLLAPGMFIMVFSALKQVFSALIGGTFDFFGTFGTAAVAAGRASDYCADGPLFLRVSLRVRRNGRLFMVYLAQTAEAEGENKRKKQTICSRD